MDSPSDAQLAGLVVRGLAAVIALVMAGAVASAAGRVSDQAGDSPVDDPVIDVALSPRGGAGPLPGTSVAIYVRSRAAALADAAGTRAAVVSFDRYVAPEEAGGLVRGVDLVALLVALPGGRPQALDAGRDVTELARIQREEAKAEKRALEELLPTVEDPDFRRQYQADIDRIAAMLTADAGRRDLVFGVLVVGRSERLRAIAAREGVRLVDVDDDAEPPPSSSYSGLRPEETARTGDPPNRPA